MNDGGEKNGNGRISENIIWKQPSTSTDKAHNEEVDKNKMKENMEPPYKETIPPQLFFQVSEDRAIKKGWNGMAEGEYRRLLQG